MIKLFENWVNERVKLDSQIRNAKFAYDVNGDKYSIIDYFLADKNIKKTLAFHDKHSSMSWDDLGYDDSDLKDLKGHILIAAKKLEGYNKGNVEVAPLGGLEMNNEFEDWWFEIDTKISSAVSRPEKITRKEHRQIQGTTEIPVDEDVLDFIGKYVNINHVRVFAKKTPFGKIEFYIDQKYSHKADFKKLLRNLSIKFKNPKFVEYPGNRFYIITDGINK